MKWFQKASKVKLPDDDASNPAATLQGNYTDHNWTPYQIRQAIAPLYGDELEAFNWVIEKMNDEHPDAVNYSDLIMWGLDEGYFITGEQGELRVSRTLP